jgi:hypothetical protein
MDGTWCRIERKIEGGAHRGQPDKSQLCCPCRPRCGRRSSTKLGPTSKCTRRPPGRHTFLPIFVPNRQGSSPAPAPDRTPRPAHLGRAVRMSADLVTRSSQPAPKWSKEERRSPSLPSLRPRSLGTGWRPDRCIDCSPTKGASLRRRLLRRPLHRVAQGSSDHPRSGAGNGDIAPEFRGTF